MRAFLLARGTSYPIVVDQLSPIVRLPIVRRLASPLIHPPPLAAAVSKTSASSLTTHFGVHASLRAGSHLRKTHLYASPFQTFANIGCCELVPDTTGWLGYLGHRGGTLAVFNETEDVTRLTVNDTLAWRSVLSIRYYQIISLHVPSSSSEEPKGSRVVKSKPGRTDLCPRVQCDFFVNDRSA